ncbi:hypothetical protein M1L60_24620 [Actinoplanes sp. TRM 88003]|uniref:Uncharacterized protein n=1 Tax=Paractinoplanes aksuensis TaxID=2939490 RepID=A0ABT1DUR5_9ACTN|nr:hypothetical protein [Actinoplanes aksuensis]MCO8273786.1 hypothetical protein [Actinoplanes aksuensis]
MIKSLLRPVLGLAALSAVLLGAAGPAAAAPSIRNYPTKIAQDAVARYGSAHIQWISGTTWDIAVADERYDGRTVCVRIQPSEAAAIDYCDNNGSANGIAQHYRISYPWYQAKVCVGAGGNWEAWCASYITRSIYDI